MKNSFIPRNLISCLNPSLFQTDHGSQKCLAHAVSMLQHMIPICNMVKPVKSRAGCNSVTFWCITVCSTKGHNVPQGETVGSNQIKSNQIKSIFICTHSLAKWKWQHSLKILKVKIRVLAAWNNHRGLAEPGSQLISALDRNRTQVGKKTEAQIGRGKTLFLCYEGSLK